MPEEIGNRKSEVTKQEQTPVFLTLIKIKLFFLKVWDEKNPTFWQETRNAGKKRVTWHKTKYSKGLKDVNIGLTYILVGKGESKYKVAKDKEQKQEKYITVMQLISHYELFWQLD